MPDNIVALMAKYPELGKVKTRIAEESRNDLALAIYKALLSNVVKNCKPTNKLDFRLGCLIAPADMIGQFRDDYSGFAFYLPQVGNNLGQRMKNGLSILFEEQQATKVVLIGADIPNLSSDHILQTITMLDENDIVIGPAIDGGYYLIGQKELHSELFGEIDWGSDQVLKQTLEKADKAGLKVGLLEELSDLDHLKDLESFPRIRSAVSDN